MFSKQMFVGIAISDQRLFYWRSQPGTYVTGERLGGALEMGRRDFYSAKDNYITSLNPVMRQH